MNSTVDVIDGDYEPVRPTMVYGAVGGA